MKLKGLLKKITPLPWRVIKDKRYSPDGKSVYAFQWRIDSKTRKAMALLEVWEITKETKKNPEKRKEQNETLREVDANAAYMVHATKVLPELVKACDGLDKVLAWMEPVVNGRPDQWKADKLKEILAALEKAKTIQNE